MSEIISPQGYHYGEEPAADNPFWTQGEIAENLTATASVDDTTGTPAVDVTKDGWNVDFAFTGLKGEQGETGATGPQGAQGIRGETGATGPQGVQGKQGVSSYISSVTATVGTTSSDSPSCVVSDNVEYDTDENSTITAYKHNYELSFIGIKGAKGDAGETGPQGATGATPDISMTATVDDTTGVPEVTISETGTDEAPIFNFAFTGLKGEKGEQGDATNAVSDVTVTNTDGVYTVSQTKNGTTTDVGEIDVPNTDNLLAEVTDSVVENTTSGYDYHTVKETENNGTQNDVGSFYIARNQITALNSDGTFTTVDQSGAEGTGQITIPESVTLPWGQWKVFSQMSTITFDALDDRCFYKLELSLTITKSNGFYLPSSYPVTAYVIAGWTQYPVFESSGYLGGALNVKVYGNISYSSNTLTLAGIEFKYARTDNDVTAITYPTTLTATKFLPIGSTS